MKVNLDFKQISLHENRSKGVLMCHCTGFIHKIKIIFPHTEENDSSSFGNRETVDANLSNLSDSAAELAAEEN